MTLAVWDGKTLLVDKMMVSQTAYALHLRRSANKPGERKGDAEKIEYAINDAFKLMRPKKAVWEGHKILAWVMSGTVTNIQEMEFFMERNDFMYYYRAELAIADDSARRNINDDNSFIFIMEDKDTKKHFVRLIRGCEIYRVNNWVAIGSGSTSPQAFAQFIPDYPTAHESLALAISTTDTVSREYDWFCPSTGQYGENEILSERQREWLLKRVHARMDMETNHVIERSYLNEQ